MTAKRQASTSNSFGVNLPATSLPASPLHPRDHQPPRRAWRHGNGAARARPRPPLPCRCVAPCPPWHGTARRGTTTVRADPSIWCCDPSGAATPISRCLCPCAYGAVALVTRGLRHPAWLLARATASSTARATVSLRCARSRVCSGWSSGHAALVRRAPVAAPVLSPAKPTRSEHALWLFAIHLCLFLWTRVARTVSCSTLALLA